MTPNTLNVSLAASPARHYPIYIGHGLLADAALIAACAPQRQICIVTNDTVAAHYLAPLEAALADKTRITVRLPDGEAHKTLATWASILDALVEARYDRDCLVIALGGGIVGDIAGFAAASYQRGIACLQIPTTLLAQVDSSVGGKTGVNHPQGKNLIGAFTSRRPSSSTPPPSLPCRRANSPQAWPKSSNTASSTAPTSSPGSKKTAPPSPRTTRRHCKP